MYLHPRLSPLDIRDVIAAWLVCFAVAVAVLAYPGFSRQAPQQAQPASRNAAQTVPATEFCSVRAGGIVETRG
ncbi:MAG: hypothetical protein AB7T18_08110 [Alphaproteobacteria bacterium]